MTSPMVKTHDWGVGINIMSFWHILILAIKNCIKTTWSYLLEKNRVYKNQSCVKTVKLYKKLCTCKKIDV